MKNIMSEKVRISAEFTDFALRLQPEQAGDFVIRAITGYLAHLASGDEDVMLEGIVAIMADVLEEIPHSAAVFREVSGATSDASHH